MELCRRIYNGIIHFNGQEGEPTEYMAVILLLEDEESVNRGISFTLTKEGYEVVSCSTVKEARKEFRRRRPDMLICDLTLPDGNGLDFVKEVRSCSGAYIICLTALDGEMDYVAGYGSGADDYVTKPFSLSVLTLKIGAYFDRSCKKEAGRRLCSGDLVMEEDKMQVFCRGTEISLTKNEWKLLLMFLQHPNQILTKNQMLQQLFDMEGDFVDENTIAVNVRRLREKIEPDISAPVYIKNVRGVGYVWSAECRRG